MANESGIATEIAAAVAAAVTTALAALGAVKVRNRTTASSSDVRHHCSKEHDLEVIYNRLAAIENKAAALEAVETIKQSTLARMEQTLDLVSIKVGNIDSRLSNVEGYNSAMKKRGDD